MNKKEQFTILVGSGPYTADIYSVICNESELATIAMAHYRQKREEERRPIACIAKRGKGVAFNNYDFMFADCM